MQSGGPPARLPEALGHEQVEEREDPGGDEDDEEPERAEEPARAPGDHLGVAVGVEPGVVPLRPAHPEREDPDEHDLAVAERDAVEAGLGGAVVVLDEEAVEQVERVEGDALMIVGHPNEIISRPTFQSTPRTRSKTYSLALTTKTRQAAVSEAIRMPLTPRFQTATSRMASVTYVSPRVSA